MKPRMKRILLFACLVIAAAAASSQNTSPDQESVDLEALYQQIDEAISQSPKFVADYEKQIAACRDSLRTSADPERQLRTVERLFRLYRPYKNDSAIHYAELGISLAQSLHRPDHTGLFRSLLALQCSNTGMKVESLEQLHLVDRAALSQEGLVAYYIAWMHLSGEMASYTQRQSMRQSYFDLQNLYRDSVMMVASEGSEESLHLKMDIFTAQRHFQDALRISNRWLKMVEKDTHERAYACFYRSMVFDHLRNHDMTCYWLGKSALYDIRCAVMNQASLLFLAEHLANDGDIDRAQRYLDFTRECNAKFTPNMLTYQVHPVINILEKSHEATQHEAHQYLIIAAAIIILLLLALIIVIIKKRR